MSLNPLVDQIEDALGNGQYFLALFVSLSIPDIAAAISSENGEARGTKYISWYEKWVRPKFALNLAADWIKAGHSPPTNIENPFDGESCYYYRCGMLHQARSTHTKSHFSRVVFIEPNFTSHRVHYHREQGHLTIDLPWFCQEVIQGFRHWVETEHATVNYQRNIALTMQRYPTGFKGIIEGLPLIS
ncbi:MAG: hypothetical protein V4586_13150 [Pseudomonadota bacterium]